MKANFCLSLAIVLVFGALAQAQPAPAAANNSMSTSVTPFPAPFNYGPATGYFYGSSTAAEGYLRGIGEVWRGKGEYNLATSAAAINFAEARRREMEDNKQWVQTYFEIRDINRQARDAELKIYPHTAEEWARFAQIGKPRPLSASELDTATGHVRWPDLFRSGEFAVYRAQLEKAFADRAYHGRMSAEGRAIVAQATDHMLASLKSHIREMPASDYLQARQFLTGLAHEASQPVA